MGCGGAEFGGQLRSTRSGQLVGVETQAEVQRLCPLEDTAALLDAEDAWLAEDVAVTRQLFASHQGQHFFAYEIDVCLGTAAIFIGDVVRTKKCRDVFDGRPGVQPSDDAQHPSLALERTPVPR